MSYLRRALLRFRFGVGGLELFRIERRQRLAFFQSNAGDRDERCSHVANRGALIDFLSWTIMLPDQILNRLRNHSPVPEAHVHLGRNRLSTSNGVALMFIHFASLAARSSKRNGPFVPCLTGGNA